MTIKPVFFMIIKRKDVAVIHEIRQYIEDNLAKEIPVGSLCKKFGINRTKLQVGFNQLYGVSVHSFIHQARMNQARNLLADTEESIKVIAFEIGYKNLSSFIRAFTKLHKMPPTQYRSKTSG